MSRVPSAVRALMVVAAAFAVAVVKYALSDPIVDAAGTRQEIPQPPPKPKHATERFGPASDGGRAIVRRSGHDWVWVWIESEPTSNCTPGGSLPNGYVYAGSPPMVRKDGSFEFRDEIRNTFQMKQRPKELPHKLDNAPFHITYRITGRFDRSGAARGTFTRHDELYHNGKVAQACDRRSTWIASRAGPAR